MHQRLELLPPGLSPENYYGLMYIRNVGSSKNRREIIFETHIGPTIKLNQAPP